MGGALPVNKVMIALAVASLLAATTTVAHARVQGGICQSLHAKCVMHVGGSCDPKTGLKYPALGHNGLEPYYQCLTDHGRKNNPKWQEHLRKTAIGRCITTSVPYYPLNDKQAQLRMPSGGQCTVGYVSGTTASFHERPRHARVSMTQHGSVRFDPSPGYRGSDRMVLRVCPVRQPNRCWKLTYDITVD